MPESPITARTQDFAAWYQDVVLSGDMAETAEIVKGCMVIKPNGYAVWELLQRQLDDRFKATGHQNVYFPLLIPESESLMPETAIGTWPEGKRSGDGGGSDGENFCEAMSGSGWRRKLGCPSLGN